MTNIPNIRIGNTIELSWSILTNGAALPLDVSVLTLFIETPRKTKIQLEFRVDGNIVKATYQGSEQKMVGVYNALLYRHYGERNQSVVDTTAFNLVARSDSGNPANDMVHEQVVISTADIILGAKGDDGFSPIITTETIDGGHKVIITDSTHTEEVNVMNGYTPQKGVDYFDGDDGYTPQKGTDYWTPEDVADIERAKSNASQAAINANTEAEKIAPAITQMRNDIEQSKASLAESYNTARLNLIADYNAKKQALEADYDETKGLLNGDYQERVTALELEYQDKVVQLTNEYEQKQQELKDASDRAINDNETATNNANLATTNANNAANRANASATNADEKASLVQDNINLNTQKADNAVHTSTEAKSVADDALFKAQGAVGTANSAVQLAQQAKAIAEGKNNSRVFDNKAALNSWLTVAENKAQLKVGDNFYIIATDSPDYWWDGESLQVLESEHPDLTEYVKNTDIATATNPGVVKVNPSYGLDVTTPSNTLYVTKSSNSEIVAKINGYKPIVPATLDYAVKVGVTTNTIALTPEEQITAKQWLGIVPISQEDYEALVDKSGINFVIPDDYD